MYQWWFANSWKYGIYSPEALRNDDGGIDEYWHWEFHGPKGQPKPLPANYTKPFTRNDLKIIRQNGVTSPADKYFETYFKATNQ
jgi:hypothetical protein